MNIGIVNQEVMNFQDCANTSLITAVPKEDSCDLFKVSCRFIEELGDELATKVNSNDPDLDHKFINLYPCCRSSIIQWRKLIRQPRKD